MPFELAGLDFIKVNRKYSEERYDEYQTDNHSYIMRRFFIRLGRVKTLQETAESKEVTQPEAVTLMTETELRKTLVGNTYEGESVRYPGSTYIDFIQPDGTIRSQ